MSSASVTPPQFVYTLPERVYSVDVKYPVMVVATADKKFWVFNLENPQKPFRVRSSRFLGDLVSYSSSQRITELSGLRTAPIAH